MEHDYSAVRPQQHSYRSKPSYINSGWQTQTVSESSEKLSSQDSWFLNVMQSKRLFHLGFLLIFYQLAICQKNKTGVKSVFYCANKANYRVIVFDRELLFWQTLLECNIQCLDSYSSSKPQHHFVMDFTKMANCGSINKIYFTPCVELILSLLPSCLGFIIM